MIFIYLLVYLIVVWSHTQELFPAAVAAACVIGHLGGGKFIWNVFLAKDEHPILDKDPILDE